MPCAVLRCVAIAFLVCALASPSLVATQACERLHFSQFSRDRNTLMGRCHDIANEVNVVWPSILLNGTTPPAECFNTTYLEDNTTVKIVFTANCEGYMQCEKNGHLSRAHRLDAYPSDSKPPPTRAIVIHVFAGQDVTLRSTVRGSSSGQVRVKWTHLDPRGKTNILFPNGCDNSLTISNVTTVGSGDYYAVASTTANDLINTRWKNADGQHYDVRVEKFDFPKFTGNLTCEQVQRTVTCSTRATGYLIKYQWFVNDVLLTPNDDRVVTIANAAVTLDNLTSQDKRLTVRVSSMDSTGKEHSVTQSAALMVMTAQCIPTSQGITGHCQTVFIPVVVIPTVILIIVLFTICFCLVYRRRNCSPHNIKPCLKLDAIDSNGDITKTTLTCFSNEHRVLKWLKTVILTLDCEAIGNEDLRQKLQNLLQQLQNNRRASPQRTETCEDFFSEPAEGEREIDHDGDKDDGLMMIDDDDEQAMIQSMINHLKNILSNE